MPYISVDECRTFLGEAAAGHSQDQIEQLRDCLESLALVMYDEIVRQSDADPENVRWTAYAFDNPAEACASDIPDNAFPTEGPNLLDFSDEDF